jgi:hypothetical protein
MTESTTEELPFSVELAPATYGGLPEPVEFTRQFKAGIERAFAVARAELGESPAREDTFALHRTLAKGFELAKGYKGGFEAGRKLFADLQAELLADAVGEQDGVPTSDLTIPDAEGDITLKVGSSNVHTIDVEGLKAAVAAHVIGHDVIDGPATRQLDGSPTPDHYASMSFTTAVRRIVEGDSPDDPESLGEVLAEALMQAMDVYATLGAFTPQVSKVREFAAEVARQGDDPLSGAVLATIDTKRKLDGVTMARKTIPRKRR